MVKNLEVFPVTKNGKFFGYADATQIAANPSLELYDERKAETVRAEAAVADAKAEQEKQAETMKAIEAAGSDPAAVKKGPSVK
jgi:hypothetical protein